MSYIVNLSGECSALKTNQHVTLNLQNRICKVEIPSKNEWIYFKFISESSTTISGVRLQQDQYDNNKFLYKLINSVSVDQRPLSLIR